ncbi:hypothetical protein ACJRO7_004002 [Eucalyptus globulus]|uniref:Uncharacterized protein n=1 Tax=Eucalyptus globulus TaxID=34317 RepID=A0ABD3IYJ1_EUCGL
MLNWLAISSIGRWKTWKVPGQNPKAPPPRTFLPLTLAYFRHRAAEGPSAHLVLMDPFLFAGSAVIGLAFTAGFAFLLVRQQFTSYSINSIFLLTMGAGILAMHTSSNRPAGESKGAYYAGFFMKPGPKAKHAITYSLVLEIQLVMCFFASAFCTIAIGIIFCASSLFSGIMIAVLLPVTDILGGERRVPRPRTLGLRFVLLRQTQNLLRRKKKEEQQQQQQI